MNGRTIVCLLLVGCAARVPSAQEAVPVASRYLDVIRGLTVAEAVAQAIEREPSLRAARSDVDAVEVTPAADPAFRARRSQSAPAHGLATVPMPDVQRSTSGVNA